MRERSSGRAEAVFRLAKLVRAKQGKPPVSLESVQSTLEALQRLVEPRPEAPRPPEPPDELTEEALEQSLADDLHPHLGWEELTINAIEEQIASESNAPGSPTPLTPVEFLKLLARF